MEDLRQTVGRWVEDAVTRLRQDRVNARRVGMIVQRFLTEAAVERFEDLRPARLMDWLGKESQAKRPRTVRNQLAAIRQWSRFLAATEAIEDAPFESVRVARCDSDDGCDAITDEQAEALIRNARQEISAERWQVHANAGVRFVAYLMMIDLGLRISEVRSQAWSDIDLARRTMRVTRDKAKRRDLVELTPRLAAALRWLRWRQQISGENPERVCPSGPNAKKVRSDLDRVGCRGQSGVYHRLRKFAITSRAEDGWGVWDLVRFARHRDPKTTMRYIKPSSEVRRSVIHGISTGARPQRSAV